MSTPTAAPNASSRPWLHWGLIVAALYVAFFTLFSIPFFFACFPTEFKWTGLPGMLELYGEWGWWIFVGIIALGQFLFLRVPVRLAFQRPVSRKSIWLPVLVSGFWFACLVLGGGFALIEAFKMEADNFPWWVIGLAVMSWIIWTIVFMRISHVKESGDHIALQRNWLLRGSILELLIAVPSHIIARGRTDCCAGFLTFFGITMGVSVMLLSFGPAVFLLYHARSQRLKSPG